MNEPQHSILVVEDDPGILFGLRDNFQLAGYRVFSAVDGKLGLDLAIKERPDLVILDRPTRPRHRVRAAERPIERGGRLT